MRDGAGPRAAREALGAAPPRETTLERAAAKLARLGASLLPFGAPGYPPKLTVLDDAPAVLALRGDASSLTAPAVGVVGSRAASAYGLSVARRVSAELAEAGVVVVSGLAFGVDGAAHSGALEAGGRSVAVQACGLDHVYPAAHRALADRIAASGAVVTEFPIGMTPRKSFFPLRNRLISGLSGALLVVEARERSGSLVTARHAAEQGVEVFAVPGPIATPQHRGSNRLLRDGAAPLLDATDLLEALAWPSTRRVSPVDDPPSAAATEILAALRHASSDTDALARRLCCATAELATPLLELELRGMAARDRDGRWRALT
jgi:DNA processing protein